ncbi:unnamed protein product [Rotaria magnacalcarata]|uniref:Paramyosin n=1 Tax=Rotaria magnacalcarata TaxID=392030 RepID=A0A819N3Q9_9BILA|nr:unnamed protein product [Rotaria magnacalcarata]CAF1601624.1 unnamed protein product [Rotaria magnacalcarata]CAF1980453.1 unnamed protein product [Rotaria magnacalcarata]CAF2166280.1 unnamed protein product [Rotaria magnacalcarata]CAF3991880.1 unnamed protein product [Rotaria magnacalcarata]
MTEAILANRLRDLEEEIKMERDVRYRQEKELTNLRIDFDEIEQQLDEITNARDREIDNNKRFKQEIHDLRQKLELQSAENDESQNTLRRRFQDSLSELTSQVEALSKGKTRHEKENKSYILEIEELKNEVESLGKAKSQAVSVSKELEGKLIEMNGKVDDAIRQLTDSNTVKSRLVEENLSFSRRIETLEFELVSIQTIYKRIQGDYEEARLHLESEMATNRTLQSTVKTFQMDLESTKLQLDDEIEAKVELQKLLIKIQEESRHLRDRLEREIEGKNEEIEDQRRKFNARITEVQEQLTEVLAKASNLEKAKQRLQGELDKLNGDIEKYRKRADEAVRRNKQLEKEVDESRQRLNQLNAELASAVQANHNYQSELLKVKSLNEQFTEQIEIITRDKRRLQDEMDVALNQISDLNTRIGDMDRLRKQLEAEKLSLGSAIEEYREQIHIEITKYNVLNASIDKLRSDLEKKIMEKDEELESLRTNQRKQLELMQAQMEELEVRYRTETSRIKSKLQNEIDEIRIRYDSLKKIKSEMENHLKKLQGNIKEAQDRLIEEQTTHAATRELLNASEKRFVLLRAEIDELRALLDRSEKARKTTELELHDSDQRLTEANSLTSRAYAERKKFEADAMQYQGEIHDVRQELKIVDERARKLAAELIHRDEEIRHERERTAETEASKRSLDQQLRDCSAKIDEAEAYARAEGKRIAAKYEGRLGQLETEIDLERGRYQELLKELRRNERRVKELLSQVDEEQAKVLSLTDTLGKTNDRLRVYKSQIESAESSATLVLTRARRLERELDDAEQRAEVVSTTLIRSRSVHRNDYN